MNCSWKLLVSFSHGIHLITISIIAECLIFHFILTFIGSHSDFKSNWKFSHVFLSAERIRERERKRKIENISSMAVICLDPDVLAILLKIFNLWNNLSKMNSKLFQTKQNIYDLKTFKYFFFTLIKYPRERICDKGSDKYSFLNVIFFLLFLNESNR